jgi:hypothetical protein
MDQHVPQIPDFSADFCRPGRYIDALINGFAGRGELLVWRWTKLQRLPESRGEIVPTARELCGQCPDSTTAFVQNEANAPRDEERYGCPPHDRAVQNEANAPLSAATG